MTMSAAALEWIEARGLDVELADRLGLSSERRGDGGECIVLPFTRAGERVRRKYRWLESRDDRPDWFADKGGQRIAFNEDCLRDDSLIDQPVIITEGEWDCMAALQCGLARTISVPDGAPPPGQRSKDDLEGSAKYAWLDQIMPYLTKDRAPAGIILATDSDENGAALLQDLSVLLGRARCKFVTYPRRSKTDETRCKDLNEVLQRYGQKGVVETVNKASWIKVNGVYMLSELPPPAPMVIYEISNESSLRLEKRLFAQCFKMRLGDTSVLTGVPSFGKSTFCNDIVCTVADRYGVMAAWASFEQDPQRDHKRALREWYFEAREADLDFEQRRAADAWIDRHHIFLVPSEDEDATLDWLIEKMEVAVVRYGVRIIVIDPWNEIEHCRDQWETETEYIGRAIRRIKRFAKAFQVHVMIVAHPTKSVKDGDGNYKMPTLYDISGSAHWYNKADLGVIVHRENEDDTLIKVQKSRYHEIIGKPGEVRMQYQATGRRFIEKERAA